MSALASLLIWKLLLLFVSLTILRQAVSHFAGLVQKFKFGRAGRINREFDTGLPLRVGEDQLDLLLDVDGVVAEGRARFADRGGEPDDRGLIPISGVRVNRTRMTRIERIEADLFGFYPR